MTTPALPIGEKIRALDACPLFSGLSPAERALLAEMMKTERLQAGEILFLAGEPSDSVYLVAGGTLHVFLPEASLPVRALAPGELLGEYGLLAGLVRTATVRAATDALLLSLDYRRFHAFLLRFPEATLLLLKSAVERLVEAERKLQAGGRP